MASVSTGKGGRKQLQFVSTDGKRKSLYLGDVSKEFAREMGRHIDHLVKCCRMNEVPKRSTQSWVRDVLPNWKNVSVKLNELSILNNGHKSGEIFADFVEGYIGSRKDVARGTSRHGLRHRRRSARSSVDVR